MFLSILSTAATVVGFSTGHWLDGDYSAGLANGCTGGDWKSTSELSDCFSSTKNIDWSSLSSTQTALLAMMLAAMAVGAIVIVLELITALTCFACRSTLVAAYYLLVLQGLLLTVSLILFPATYDFKFPSGTHLGWSYWVVLGGDVMSIIASYVDQTIYNRKVTRQVIVKETVV
eukprot:Nk52_evm85s158 gene=Nk52_evmTU85s158